MKAETKFKTRTSAWQLLKNDEGEFTGEVKAVIATLNVVDHQRDIILSGAIGKQEVVVSDYNHSSWGSFFGEKRLPIGEGRLYEYDGEAIFKGRLFIDMERPKEIMRLLANMKEKQEWSFSLHDVEGNYKHIPNPANPKGDEEIEVFEIKKVTVKEVSPVWMGAGINTRTLVAKSLLEQSRQEQEQEEGLEETKEQKYKEQIDTLTKENEDLRKKLKAQQNETAKALFR